MEDRASRPKFVDPFTNEPKPRSRAYLKGFFRGMPLYRWPLAHIRFVLHMAAQSPTAFGFPDAPTVVVNTTSFLPSFRSRQQGVLYFGPERGCKSIIIPPPCSVAGFDSMDARLLEPLFRWNPGIEYLYLAKECQTIAHELAPLLQKCRNIKSVALVDWTDAVALRKVLLACRAVEVVDTFTVFHTKRNWQTEENVQSLTTLIEMHPKLRKVEGTRDWLLQWYDATRFSRCRHNVALTIGTCDFMALYLLLWLGGVVTFWFYIVAPVAQAIAKYVTSVWGGDYEQVSRAITVSAFASFLVHLGREWFGCTHRGLGWVWWVKWLIVCRMRLLKLMARSA